jgi:Peptidase U49
MTLYGPLTLTEVDVQDVSREVDNLLEGVVPERVEELAKTWGAGPDRVRLTANAGFDIGQRYGCIQVTKPFFDLMWLVGAGIWRGIQANSGLFLYIGLAGLPFCPSAMRKIAGQIELDNRFDRAIEAAKEMGRIANPGDFQWPPYIPYPRLGAREGSSEWQATYDLILMAGGYAFLHEIRHFQFERDGEVLDYIDQERACDTYARGMMLDKVPDYCASSGYSEELVRAKRIMGILFAKLVILTVTPRPVWSNSRDHPPVKERIATTLEATVDPMPIWFWSTVAGMLAAFARYNGLLTGAFAAMSSRELAFAICDLFDSK